VGGRNLVLLRASLAGLELYCLRWWRSSCIHHFLEPVVVYFLFLETILCWLQSSSCPMQSVSRLPHFVCHTGIPLLFVIPRQERLNHNTMLQRLRCSSATNPLYQATPTNTPTCGSHPLLVHFLGLTPWHPSHT